MSCRKYVGRAYLVFSTSLCQLICEIVVSGTSSGCDSSYHLICDLSCDRLSLFSSVRVGIMRIAHVSALRPQPASVSTGTLRIRCSLHPGTGGARPCRCLAVCALTGRGDTQGGAVPPER